MILNILKNLILLTISAVAGHFLAIPFALLLTPILDIGGSFLGDALEYYMFGLPMVVGILLVFLFEIFGDKYRYVWIGIGLLPIILFEIQLAPILVIFSTVLTGIAWWLGKMTNKALWKLAPGVMAKIG